MEYVFIPTGGIVSVADGKRLPPALYAPVKKEPKRKAAPRKRAVPKGKTD